MTSRFFNPRTLLLFAVLTAGILFLIYQNTRSGSVSSKNVETTTALSAGTATTQVSSPAAPNPASGFTPQSADLNTADAKAQEQLGILEEVLRGHNDNDPRMDRELLTLNEAAKEVFRKKYHSLPAEKRNDRGTIVFLLGRNLTTAADFAFLQDVLNENPCLSLTDCSKTETGGQSREKDEHQGGFAVTLAYPQLVALHSLENYLGNKSSNGALADKARDVVASAKHSTIPEVSRMAEAIEGKGPR